MDSLGDRALFLHNIDKLLTFNKDERSRESDQDSLFGKNTMALQNIEIDLEKTGETKLADKLMWEKELLGLYISGHPLDSYKHKLENREINIQKLKETAKEKDSVVIGGIIEEMRNVMTKNGEKMVFLKMADLSDSIEAVVFPRVLGEFADLFILDSCIVVKGIFSIRNKEKSIIIDKVKPME